MKKAIAYVIVFVFCVLTIVPTISISATDVSNTANQVVQVNNFFDEIRDSEFVGDGSIYVTMHHEISDVGKVYTKSDFPELDIITITDLTGANPADTKEDYGKDFRNVLEITLSDNSRDSVIEAIEKLQKRAGIDVFWAEPVYESSFSDYEEGDEATSSEVLTNPDYWKNIIQLDEARNFLSNNGIDLNNSSQLKVAVVDGYSILNHTDLNKGSSYFLTDENGNTQTKASTHATGCAGVVDAVCDGIELVSVVMPPENDAYAFFGELNAQNVMNKLICCLNGSGESGNQETIYIATMSYARYASEYENANTCLSIMNNYKGILICLAHNDGQNLDNTNGYYNRLPSLLTSDNILVVGGSNPNDGVWVEYDENNNVSGGSNIGVVSVDMFAPAEDITTTTVDTDSNGNPMYYDTTSGTSLATPMVAGVAALMKLANPDITPLQIKAILMNTVDRSSAFIGNCVSGGRLNAYEAVRIAYGLANNTLNSADKGKAHYLFHASTKTIEEYVGDSAIANIPSTINGVSVEKIQEDSFRLSSTITSLVIPEGVSEIGARAFMQCAAMKSVVIPSTVTVLPDRAFLGCMALEDITLPTTLTSIGTNALYNCGYESIAIPPSVTAIGSYAFDTDAMLIVQYDSDAYDYGLDNAYSTCVVTNNKISGYYSSGEGGLRHIDIPSSFFGTTITSVGAHAFDGAVDVELINIPTTVTEIGYRAFRNCTYLKTIVVPDSVTSIINSMNATIVDGSTGAAICCTSSSYASQYAASNGISRLLMRTANTGTVAAYAAACGLFEVDGRGTEYVIPSTFAGIKVTQIDPSAFSSDVINPYNITKMTIPSTVTVIGGSAFANCTTLTDIYIYSSTATIGTNCFAGISNTSLRIHCISGSPAHTYAQTYMHPYTLL